ncbi:Helix-turn-helix domain protein [Actinomadura rubteroloni]|uniref:Helix-turn-helix domain protein n=1 Tax=Actinomadura rubteroloni TaxID=1926885 RepID=A0A2P4URQ7_9ACTN|nr:helix-turn-helix transcriptional regulator [Actinomadura rubteroloni]POM27740.1 Helix-turn-helix domain protein [Actinomadura rubteroloni]
MAPSRWVTLRAQWLGQQLRNLREENGLLLKEVAEYLERDPATLSRYESGIYPIQSPELMKLLDLYRVSDEHRRFTLLKLGDEAWQKGWWDGYSPDLADWFSDYIWLESRADRIQMFDNVVLPGLLQTEEYGEAVMRTTAWDLDDESIRRMLELRMTRKAILAKPKPPQLSVVLDEAVVRRVAGSPEVFAAQLRYVAECAERPNIEIRVLPFKAGIHPSDTGSFKIFTMPEPFPQIAHADTPQGSIYIESPQCDRLVDVYDRLRKLSLNPADSVELISAVAEELE